MCKSKDVGDNLHQYLRTRSIFVYQIIEFSSRSVSADIHMQQYY